MAAAATASSEYMPSTSASINWLDSTPIVEASSNSSCSSSCSSIEDDDTSASTTPLRNPIPQGRHLVPNSSTKSNVSTSSPSSEDLATPEWASPAESFKTYLGSKLCEDDRSPPSASAQLAAATANEVNDSSNNKNSRKRSALAAWMSYPQTTTSLFSIVARSAAASKRHKKAAGRAPRFQAAPSKTTPTMTDISSTDANTTNSYSMTFTTTCSNDSLLMTPSNEKCHDQTHDHRYLTRLQQNGPEISRYVSFPSIAEDEDTI
ncbi:hypothetical protein TRVA0_075S00474 [Trichomonascus vanleenenianus]|uniref:uncharacterized protein n=1 Tax=Trichomonascus vanleenenianus TaxID=2268995 RepID=UPI003ECA79AE